MKRGRKVSAEYVPCFIFLRTLASSCCRLTYECAVMKLSAGYCRRGQASPNCWGSLYGTSKGVPLQFTLGFVFLSVACKMFVLFCFFCVFVFLRGQICFRFRSREGRRQNKIIISGSFSILFFFFRGAFFVFVLRFALILNTCFVCSGFFYYVSSDF